MIQKEIIYLTTFKNQGINPVCLINNRIYVFNGDNVLDSLIIGEKLWKQSIFNLEILINYFLISD